MCEYLVDDIYLTCVNWILFWFGSYRYLELEVILKVIFLGWLYVFVSYIGVGCVYRLFWGVF